MSATVEQLNANRSNSLKSAGPRSEAGKSIARLNSRRHGVLSSKLLLDDEDQEAFKTLVRDLIRDLRPVGTMELALVERIAVTLWRQRRLVTAETASIALSRGDRHVAAQAARELDGAKLKPDDLDPFDPEHEKWCRDVLEECEALDDDLNPALIPKAVPLIYAQLVQDADAEGETVEEHVAKYDNGVFGYVAELAVWCQQTLTRAEQRPQILEVAQLIRNKRLVPPSKTLELLSRYQGTLDNALFKSLRALREAQEWRLKTLEGKTIDET